MGQYTVENLYNKINNINTYKNNIKTVLSKWGINVPANTMLGSYPTYINQLEIHPDFMLEYIANGIDTASATRQDVYFDTGVASSASIKIELCCSSVITASIIPNHNHIMGACGANAAGQYSISMPTTGNTIRFAAMNGNVPSSVSYVPAQKYTITTWIENNTPHIIVNGVETSNSVTTSTISGNSFYLFARNLDGAVNEKSYCSNKIYYCKIWDNNNLVRFFIPVLHWDGNKYIPCFYDKINDTYIYNLGTDDVHYKRRPDILLDYIANGPDGTSGNKNYVETGIMPNNIAFRLDTKAALYDTVTQQWPLGEINTGSWNGFTIYMGYASSTAGPNYVRVNSVNVTNGNLPYSSNIPMIFSAFLDLNDKNSYNQYKAYSYIDNIKYNAGTGTTGYTGNMGGANTIWLFARHRQDSAEPALPGGIKLYYVVATTADVPTKTLIPVLHNNEPCFYDLINDNYLHAAYPDILSYKKLKGDYIDLSRIDINGNLLSARETANCYVVHEIGSYEFPLVYGGAIMNGSPNAASYTNTGTSNTQPFYNYLNTQIKSPYIEADTGTTAKSVSILLNDSSSFTITDCEIVDGMLRFKVTKFPALGGNIVLGIKDSSNRVMWSWHIWAYPDHLFTVSHTNTNGYTYNMLNVDLGWVKNSTSASDKKGTAPYFQWGRKDPMLRAASYNSTTNATVVQGNFNITTIATSVGSTIQNPTTLNKGDSTKNYNWWSNNGTSVNFFNYWDASQTTTGNADKSVVKTVYDPCPVGFNIPCGNTFLGYSTSTGTWDNGWTWNNRYYPALGFRDNSSGNLSGVSSEGYHWASSSNSGGYAYELGFTSGYVGTQSGSRRGNAFTIAPCSTKVIS